MIAKGNPIARESIRDNDAIGRGGKSQKENTANDINKVGERKEDKGNKYSEDLRSRFGEAFLPFASQLWVPFHHESEPSHQAQNMIYSAYRVCYILDGLCSQWKRSELYMRRLK